MSPSEPKSSSKRESTLEVNVWQPKGRRPSNANLTIYNGSGDLIHEGPAPVRIGVPRGLYLVRAERGGRIHEQMIRHSGETNITIDEPRRLTAMPLDDSAHTHEYYQDTSRKYSRQDTGQATHATLPGGPRLMVFVRMLDRQEFQGQNLAEGLSLWDAHAHLVTDFRPEHVVRDANGWLAFSQCLAPGTYYLRHEGPPTREIPLRIHPNWDMQAFMLNRSGPLLRTLAVSMSRVGNGFNPDDELTQVLDAALASLQDGRTTLNPEHEDMLLHGKFDNPLLGLISATLHLRRPSPDWALMDVVLGNLHYLLPGSPDVAALEAAIEAQRGRGNIRAPIRDPPMLRGILESVLAASSRGPDFIPDDSLLDAVAPRLYADMPWSSWAPNWVRDGDRLVPRGRPRTKQSGGENFRMIGYRIPGAPRDFGDPGVGRIFDQPWWKDSESEPWVLRVVQDALSADGSTAPTLDLRAIAQANGLPVSVVRRAAAHLDQGDAAAMTLGT